MLSARALLLPLVLAVGCSVSQDNWSKKYADAYCSFQNRCAKEEMFYNYDDESDCKKQVQEQQDETNGSSSTGCTFNQDKAQECVDDLGETCKHFAEDLQNISDTCDAAWDCSG